MNKRLLVAGAAVVLGVAALTVPQASADPSDRPAITATGSCTGGGDPNRLYTQDFSSTNVPFTNYYFDTDSFGRLEFVGTISGRCEQGGGTTSIIHIILPTVTIDAAAGTLSVGPPGISGGQYAETGSAFNVVASHTFDLGDESDLLNAILEGVN